MAQITMTRRYRFCAAHRLHTDFLTPQQNWSAFGKCNNPNGHGHNYVVLVTVNSATGSGAFSPEFLDRVVEDVIVSRFDHHDLNEDPAFWKDHNVQVDSVALRDSQLYMYTDSYMYTAACRLS